jgi:hypothetical protein
MRTFLLFATLFVTIPVVCSAEQFVSGGHVVHTRLAPVVAHRLVPPYRGVHVYAGRNTRR